MCTPVTLVVVKQFFACVFIQGNLYRFQLVLADKRKYLHLPPGRGITKHANKCFGNYIGLGPQCNTGKSYMQFHLLKFIMLVTGTAVLNVLIGSFCQFLQFHSR